MARGFLKGTIWGGIGGLGTLAALSILMEAPTVPDVTIAAPAATDAPVPAVSAAAPTTEARAPVTGQDTTQAPAPQPDDLIVGVETQRPAGQPQTGAISNLAEPDPGQANSGVSADAVDAPVVAPSLADGLTAPRDEADVEVALAPAQPAPNQEVRVPEPDPVQPIAPPILSENSGFAAPDLGVISTGPEQPAAPDLPGETQAFGRAPDAADVVPPVPADETATPALAATDNTAPLGAGDGGLTRPQALPEGSVATPELANDEVLAGVRQPAGTLRNLAPDVQVNRLPNLRDAAPVTLGTAAIAPNAALSTAPIKQFAAPLSNPDGKPLMAIVLMDDGVDLSASTTGLPALRDFPYPISVAVDTSLPDAGARMAAYRAAGFEVLAMIDLPQGALPQDAETSLSVALQAVPEAVGVLEGVKAGIQGSRDAAIQVADILAETGHGFVTQNNGLNTVQKLAARSGVPSAVVFRDFDSKGQTPTVIRRFLDQAAFRAGRDGSVVMLGRLREDTMTALLLWGLQDRATRVALVPVSATLSPRP